MWEGCTVLEHRKVILHYQHHFTIEFHPYITDISALSLLVLRISTVQQQQLQDNRINTQKSGCGWLWGITTLFDIDSCHSDWLIIFSLHPSLCTYLSIWSSGYKHWKHGNREHKIQIMEMIYNTNTLPVFRHTHPKSMETEADDWSHCNNRLLFYPCLHLFLFVPSVSRQADSDIGPFQSRTAGRVTWR